MSSTDGSSQNPIPDGSRCTVQQEPNAPTKPTPEPREQACCACLHVEYKPADVWMDVAATEDAPAWSGLGKRERWICRDCGGEFARSGRLADLEYKLETSELSVSILEARLEAAERNLRKAIWTGKLRECDIPACNCGGYHSQLSNRIMELVEQRDDMERERDEYHAANESAVVCAAHTPEFIGDGCLVCERDEARGKLQRVRDWLKSTANSDGGIVAEIDHLLATEEGRGDGQ